MKVEEAKNKVCPFMSNSVSGEGFTVDHVVVQNCICGDCMAWQYTKEYETVHWQPNIKKNLDTLEQEPESEYMSRMEKAGWKFNNHFDQLWEKPLHEDDKEGYCKRLGQ